MAEHEKLESIFGDHLKLLNNLKSFKVDEVFSSNYSVFAHNSKYIYKFRKYNNAFRKFRRDNVSFLESKKYIQLATKNEFEFGKMFQPDLYIDVIDVKINSMDIDSLGICMNYIKKEYNLSLYNISAEILYNAFINKMDSLFKLDINTSYEYSYYSGLIEGNNRIIDLLSSNKIFNNYILDSWKVVNSKTESLKDLFLNREDNYFVCHLHGDLSFDNLFIVNKVLKIVDPCSYFRDMFYLDKLYQIADFMVEIFVFRRKDYNFFCNNIKMYFHNLFNQELFSYYFYRHLLIRTTLGIVFNNSNKDKYLISLKSCRSSFL